MGAALSLMIGVAVLASPTSEVRPLLRAEGVITAVDHASGSLTVRDPGGDLQMALTSATTIFAKGRAGSAEDLKPGVVIKVAYERGGALQWVEVLE